MEYDEQTLRDLFDGDEPLQQNFVIELEESTTSNRFKPINEEDVEKFLDQQQNENTRKKTKGDLGLMTTFFREKGETRDPETVPPEELDALLSNFILSMRKRDCSEYEPTTLRCFISSLDRHLREKNYSNSIINDRQFQRSRPVLKSKQKELKCMGKGNKPFASDEISDDDIQRLIDSKQLGRHNPVSLLNSIWLNNCVHFGLRTGKESHDLMWGDVTLKEDDDGIQYLELSQERQTKTRTGANPRNIRTSKPQAYATPELPDRDPVGLYLLYKSKRPEAFNTDDSPFYLNKNVMNPLPGQAWFKQTPMGLNKLYKIMKEMKAGACMTDDNKRLTPYSVRKHLVQKLNDEGVPPTHIMQISGHKNVQSINNYSELNANQSKQISDLLCGRPREAMNIPTNHYQRCEVQRTLSLTTTDTETRSVQPAPCSSSSPFPGIFVGNIFNCPVNVHVHQYPSANGSASTLTSSKLSAVSTSGHFDFIEPAVPSTSSAISQ